MWKRILDIYRVLSLDVCLGVCSMSYYFSVLFRQKLEIVNYVVIFLAVFSIYSLDHIIDASSIKKSASTVRHRFFQNNLISMLVITLICIATDIVLAFKFLPFVTIKYGIIISGLVFFYCLVNFLSSKLRFKNHFKEVFAALIYACGVMLPSYINIAEQDFFIFIFFLQIFLIAFLNLMIFSYFDHDSDIADGYLSIVTTGGKHNALRLIYVLSFAEIMISIYTIFMLQKDLVVISIPLLMSLILLAVIYFRHYFAKNFRYRYAGDSIFFLPLILLL